MVRTIVDHGATRVEYIKSVPVAIIKLIFSNTATKSNRSLFVIINPLTDNSRLGGAHGDIVSALFYNKQKKIIIQCLYHANTQTAHIIQHITVSRNGEMEPE